MTPIYLDRIHSRHAPRQPRPWVRNVVRWFCNCFTGWKWEWLVKDCSGHRDGYPNGCKCHVCREEPFR